MKRKGLSKKQRNSVLKILQTVLVKSAGIERAGYFFDEYENPVEFVFFISKKDAGLSISYINVLCSLLEKELKTEIKRSIYIGKKEITIRSIEKEKCYESLTLSPVLFNGYATA